MKFILHYVDDKQNICFSDGILTENNQNQKKEAGLKSAICTAVGQPIKNNHKWHISQMSGHHTQSVAYKQISLS